MSNLKKVIFYLVILPLWLVALLAACELWPRLQWHLVENYNPYLKSRIAGVPWPALPGEETPSMPSEKEDEIFRGRGKSSEKLPVITSEQELRQRIPFFREYDDPQRYLFANVFGLHVFRLRRDGLLTASWSVPDYSGRDRLEMYLNDTDAQRIRAAILGEHTWEDGIHFVPPLERDREDDFGYCLATDMPDELLSGVSDDVLLIFRNTSSPVRTNIPAGSLWELPFMAYEKHSKKHDHISVLGIAEDFYINNCGFRDRDIILPKPAGVYRILCIGASTTEEGITNNHTYPARMEVLINRHFSSSVVDVVNCGISGMNSMKHWMRFPDYLALEPDMLVIYNATNDICHQLLPRLVAEATEKQRLLRHSRFIVEYFNECLLPPDADISSFIRELIMPYLRHIIHEAHERGIKTTVCSFAAPRRPLLSWQEYAYFNYLTLRDWGGSYVTFDSYLRILDIYNGELKKLCDDEGSLYIPVAENLQGGASLFGDICHLREKGIMLKSQIVADTLIPQIETEIVDR